MEPAGLALGAVGLLGLVNLYQEAARVVHSVKNHSSESLRLFSRYSATKVLFERWGTQVGVADKDSIAQSVHPQLQEPATVNAVAGLLASITNVFTDVDPTIARYEQPSTSAAANPGRTKLRSRLKWALADGDKLTQNTKDFDDLVQKLYRLVPPEKLHPDEFQKLQTSLIQFQRNQALHQVSHWLDATTTENTFDAYYSTRLDTTCNWIDTHPAYQGWLSGNPDKRLHVLWMHGPGGFGKSVLCAYVVKSLLDSGTPFVCSFFCSGNSDSQRNPRAIPRSWVHQAVHHDDDILDLVLQYLNKCGNTKATHSDVLHLLRDIISHNPTLIFVVDGLDECPRTNTERTELHRNRADVLREIMREGAGIGARLLVVSREEGDIKSQLRPHGPHPPGIKFDELAISKDNVSSDVARFAEHVVTQKLAGNQHQLCQELSAQMAQKSDGMFLLIRLQSQNLRPRKGKNQLRRAVDEMPTDIVQVYKRHWDDIQRLPPSDKQRAEAILRWVVFVRRPLTILQLSEVVTVMDTSEDDEPQFDDLPDSFDEEFVDDEILGICGSFLELRGTTPDEELRKKTVHLIHFSASEFLLGQHGYAPFADTMLQEYHLAQKCLRYIDCSATWQLELNENVELIQDRPFLVYASFHWFQHVGACANSPYHLNPRLLSFFSAANPNWSEWRSYYECPEDEVSERLGSEESDSEEGSNPEVSDAEESDSEEEDLEDDNIQEEDPEEGFTGEDDTEDRKTGSVYSETGPIPGGRTYYAALFGLEDVMTYLHKTGIFDKDQSGGEHGNPLQAAAFRGQTGALKFLLDVGANPEAEGRFGSALHAAVAGNQEGSVAMLLRHGASVSVANRSGQTPLSRSIDVGNYMITQHLLDNNSDPSTADNNGLTPLMRAAFYGRLELARLLVEKGASLSAKDNVRQTPLHWAAYGGHAPIVELLLDNGADCLLCDTEDPTPLIHAARQGHTEVAKVLLDRGANINVINKNAETPLIAAIRKGHKDIVKLLLAHNADPAITGTNDGWNALIYATCLGDLEIVRSLVDYGVDLNSCTTDGESPLLCAALNGHLCIVKYLLGLGASTAAPDSDGWTPLHHAATQNNLEIVKALLDSGASTNVFDLDGWTPLTAAAQSGHLNVVNALLDSGAHSGSSGSDGWSPLIAAVSTARLEVVGALIDAGASPSVPDSNGWSPLAFAAFQGYPEIFKILLDSGADILALADKQQTRVTPIHVASECGHVDFVQLLLDAGVDVNIPAGDGSTPLHHAVRSHRFDVIRCLLQNHASLSHQDMFGCTPFQYADEATMDTLLEQFQECERYSHPTEDARQQRIIKSIQALSGTPMPLEKKDLILLDTLGRCLLKFRDLSAAAKVFNATLQLDEKSEKIAHHGVICDECREVLFGERWVCTSCYFENLCTACMAKFPDGAERSFCSGHEYFRVPAGDWDASRQTDVYTEEFVSWLKELQVQYGVASL
jgi:ankyrin repeat protein